MKDEAFFLRALRERPRDLDVLAVYADWLEERGDLRADVTRIHRELLGRVTALPQSATHDKASILSDAELEILASTSKLLDATAAALEASKESPSQRAAYTDWLTQLRHGEAPATLVGTRWEGIDRVSAQLSMGFTWTFRPDVAPSEELPEQDTAANAGVASKPPSPSSIGVFEYEAPGGPRRNAHFLHVGLAFRVKVHAPQNLVRDGVLLPTGTRMFGRGMHKAASDAGTLVANAPPRRELVWSWRADQVSLT